MTANWGGEMALLVENMQWVLLVCGLLTFSTIQATVAPKATMRAYFGDAPDSPTADLLARNWGILIAVGGAFLAYAGFHPEYRTIAIVVVGVGKLAFILLVLWQGGTFLKKQAGVAIVIDSIMLAIFAACLWAIHG